MITHVYSQAMGVWFFVSCINLIDERPQKGGTTTYEVDLVSEQEPEITLFNVPLTVTEYGSACTYAMPDISAVLEDTNTYNYHDEKKTQLYDCEYSPHKGVLFLTEATLTEAHATVSIYQPNEEHTTKGITTISELIDTLEQAQSMPYTEVVVSGTFTRSTRSK